LLHELGHRLMVWWTQGSCRTPEYRPVLAEAGNFIERQFLGAPIGGWWSAGKVGKFRHLKAIGVVYGGASKLFDDRISNQISKALMNIDTSLPLINLSLLPSSDTSQLVHAKSGLMNREEGNSEMDDGRKPMELVGLGLSFTPIRNDVIMI